MADEQSHPLYQETPPPKSQDDETRKLRPVRISLPGVVQQPYVTYGLIIVNVALFALTYISPQMNVSLLNWGISITENIVQEKEFYRLLSSMFLHANLPHLLFNMWALYYVGGYIERIFGHLRFSLIYFLGGLLGSLLPLFFSEAGLGASGAIFAVWGAEAVFLYQHRKLFGAMGQARLRNSLVLMGINLFIGLGANVLSDAVNAPLRIGNAAHLGGVIGGAALAWFIGPKFLVERITRPTENEAPIRIVQGNRLVNQVSSILVYMIALASLLLMAVMSRS